MTEIELGPRSLRAIVDEVAARYPIWIFPDPTPGCATDCYSAAGARLACRSILAELERTAKPEYPEGIHPAKTPMTGGFSLEAFAPSSTPGMAEAMTASMVPHETHMEVVHQLDRAQLDNADLLDKLEQAEDERDKLDRIANKQVETIIRQAKRLGAIDSAAANLPEMPVRGFLQHEKDKWAKDISAFSTLMRDTAAALQVRNAELEDIASDRLAQLRDQAILTKATQDKCDALKVRVEELETIAMQGAGREASIAAERDAALAESEKLKLHIKGMEFQLVQESPKEKLLLSNLRDAQAEAEGLRRENEQFRTSNEHQFATVHADLCETLGVPPGGSVIEAVEGLRRDLEKVKEEARESYGQGFQAGLCRYKPEYNPIEFEESDGTMRRIVYEKGDDTVGLEPGWGVDDNAWEDHEAAARRQGAEDEREKWDPIVRHAEDLIEALVDNVCPTETANSYQEWIGLREVLAPTENKEGM